MVVSAAAIAGRVSITNNSVMVKRRVLLSGLRRRYVSHTGDLGWVPRNSASD